MELITYDKEKCDGCGLCAAVCICDVQIQKEINARRTTIFIEEYIAHGDRHEKQEDAGREGEPERNESAA